MNEAVATAYRTWMCVVCGFIYDEAQGLPEEGIAPGTRWEDVPETWTCPDCGVTKDDFSANKAPSHGRGEQPDWSDDYDRRIRLYYIRTA